MPELLTPNSPLTRFQYVAKTYLGKPAEPVLFDVASFAASLVGADSLIAKIQHTYGEYMADVFGSGYAMRIGMPQLIRRGYSPENPAAPGGRLQVLDRLAQLMHMLESNAAFQRRHEYDFLIPWVASKLAKQWKRYIKGQALDLPEFDYGVDQDVAEYRWNDTISELMNRSTAIGQWAVATRQNMGKVSIVEALEAAADFKVGHRGKVPQGLVVHRFKDGWTIQRLDTAEQLDAEGEIMQHCVASYCEAVQQGDTVIFSLRDPKGQPHVTFEWATYSTQGYLHGHWEQIQGKQNQLPIPKYHPYIKEFVEQYGNPPDAAVVLRLGIDPTGMDLSGEDLADTDLPALTDVDLSDVTLTGATLGAQYENVSLHGAKLDEVTLRGNFIACSFDEASLYGIRIEVGATFEHCSFGGAALDHVATQRPTSPEDVPIQFWNCDFNGTRFLDSAFRHVAFYRCDFTNAEIEHTYLVHVSFQSSNLSNMTLADIRGRGLDLRDADLSDMDPDDARKLIAISYEEGGVKLPPELEEEQIRFEEAWPE